MRAKRSLAERTKASVESWMPLDTRHVVLASAIAFVLLVLVPLLH